MGSKLKSKTVNNNMAKIHNSNKTDRKTDRKQTEKQITKQTTVQTTK